MHLASSVPSHSSPKNCFRPHSTITARIAVSRLNASSAVTKSKPTANRLTDIQLTSVQPILAFKRNALSVDSLLVNLQCTAKFKYRITFRSDPERFSHCGDISSIPTRELCNITVPYSLRKSRGFRGIPVIAVAERISSLPLR